jgi:hypothetical protein
MSARLERLRKALPTLLEAVLALAVLAFVVISIWWFVEVVTDDTELSARDAFVGLGYFAGVVLIVLVAWAAIRGWTGVAGGRRMRSGSELDADRYIIVTQLRYGAALIVFGAAIGIIFGLAFTDDKGVALALGTAAVGAGAAMLPGGASASATARMNKKLEAEASANGAPNSEPEADEVMDPDALAEHPDHPSNELDAGEAEVEGGTPEMVGADEDVEGDAPPVLDDDAEEGEEPQSP